MSAKAFIEALDDVAMGPAFDGSWPVMVVPGLRNKKRGLRAGGGLAALVPVAN